MLLNAMGKIAGGPGPNRQKVQGRTVFQQTKRRNVG